jgi:hypothetical protein
MRKEHMSTNDELIRARLELRLLGEEAIAYSERVNARISEILSRFEPSAFFGAEAHIGRILEDVPGVEELEEFEETATRLTQGPFRLLPSAERAYMAQVRCAIADAVAAARRGQYRQALAASQRGHMSMQRIMQRQEGRLGSDLETALSESLAAIGAIVATFAGAERALSGAR